MAGCPKYQQITINQLSEPIHINKGVRQGCGLSPVLFKIYINKIIQEFKTVIKKGIQLNNRKLVNKILYVDDQILMATSEGDLQTMAHHLNLIARKYKNQCIRQKTGAQNKTKEIKQYQKKWLQHVQRMDTDRLPKQALQYKPKVATTCTVDGHKQTTKTSTTI